MRVVSLLPSGTEVVCLLAASAAGSVRLVGRSHECDFPADGTLDQVPVLTAPRTRFESSFQVDQAVREALAAGQSLYTLDTKQLEALKPDVIVTQDLCEVCSIDLATVRAAAQAMDPRPAIVSLNPTTLEGMMDDVMTVGRALGLHPAAREVVVRLRERLYRAEEFVNPYDAKPRVAFIEWTAPLFAAGHWTPQLIERAGGLHPLNPTLPAQGAGAGAGPIGQTLRAAGRSIAVTPEALVASEPDRVIVCPCGLGLEQTRREFGVLSREPWWRKLPAARTREPGCVALVDGNQYFNRPGPRLVDAFEFLVGWLNGRPGVIPHGFAWEPWTVGTR